MYTNTIVTNTIHVSKSWSSNQFSASDLLAILTIINDITGETDTEYLDAVNSLCIFLNGVGKNLSVIEGLNEIGDILSGSWETQTKNIDALNVILVLLGGSGEHSGTHGELHAWQEIESNIYPVCLSAFVDETGLILSIVFNMKMDNVTDYITNFNTTRRIISGSLNSENRKIVELILESEIYVGESPTLGYYKGSVKSKFNTILDTFTDVAITNNSIIGKPTLLSEAYTGRTGEEIFLRFNKTMKSMIDFVASDFSFDLNGTTVYIDEGTFDDADPYYFYLHDGEYNFISIQKGDVLKISIASRNIESTDDELLEAVIDFVIENRVYDEIKLLQTATTCRNAHGTCQVGTTIFTANRTPSYTGFAKIYKHANLNDLSDSTYLTLTDRYNVESMCYDSIRSKIYATSWNNDSKGTILEIAPDLSTFNVVYNSTEINFGSSPAIVTDGVFIYGITLTTPAKVFKIRISDWSLVDSVTIAESSKGHAMVLKDYGGKIEIYAVCRKATTENAFFLKINPNTLVYDICYIPEVNSPTDDFCIRINPLDNQHCYAYIQGELQDRDIAIVDTKKMTYEIFTGAAGYGTFTDGTDMYFCMDYGEVGIGVMRSFDPGSIEKYSTNSSRWFNELFFHEGRIFATDFNSTGIHEISLPT